MKESLKAQRERAADRGYADGDEFTAALRELQRAAMEAVLRDMEYEQRPDGGWAGVGWDTLKPHYVDALLDGPQS